MLSKISRTLFQLPSLQSIALQKRVLYQFAQAQKPTQQTTSQDKQQSTGEQKQAQTDPKFQQAKQEQKNDEDIKSRDEKFEERFKNLDKEDEDTSEKQNKGRTAKAEQENVNMQQMQQKINITWNIWRLIFWSSVGLFSYNYYLLEKKPNPQLEIGYQQFFFDAAVKTKQSIKESIDFFTKPPMKKLLPDMPPIPPGMDVPKTLVLNLSGTLIHTEFVFGKGCEVLKRPGLTQFLRHLIQFYEIVIFSNDDTMFTFQISEKLDPGHQIFAGRLGKESLCYDSHKYIKDLRYLNRDMRKIVVIDKDIEMLKLQPDNCIVLKEYTGDKDDKSLLELLPLLEHIAKSEVKDVRKEIAKYGQNDGAKRFNEEMAMKIQQLKKQQQEGLTGIFKGQNSKTPSHFSKSNFGKQF